MTSISALRLKANGMAPAYCSCCGPIGSIGEHRPLMCTLASTSARTPSLPLLLDAVVASANRCLILDVRYKPYWIMSDLAALSGLGFALAFSSHLRQVSAFGLRAGILGALPKSIFALKCNGWRRYSPSPDPRQRVFPIQLVESGAQLSLFAVLTFLLWERPQADRYIFPLYLALYAITRLGLDCYRVTSARPRYGRFTEAQLVCVCVLAAACLYLAYMLMN
jgi:prolipoprotein diacylglyceryl transferase